MSTMGVIVTVIIIIILGDVIYSHMSVQQHQKIVQIEQCVVNTYVLIRQGFLKDVYPYIIKEWNKICTKFFVNEKFKR